MEYMKGVLALFVLLMLLLYLVPGEGFKKYIRFFGELVLTIGFLSPVLNLIYDSDQFLALIDYEQYSGQMSELTRDMERVEYIQKDYYLKEYETAIAGDVTRIAEQYGFEVEEAKVDMNEAYTLDAICLSVSEQGTEGIEIERVWLDGTEGEKETEASADLRKELAEYYQLEEEAITIKEE